jgi:hypothetical protein
MIVALPGREFCNWKENLGSDLPKIWRTRKIDHVHIDKIYCDVLAIQFLRVHRTLHGNGMNSL